MIENEDSLNIDSFGFICKIGSIGEYGGGDSAANEGTYFFCKPFEKKRYLEIIPQLEYRHGLWRRHPDTSKWFAIAGGMECMSRDQMIPILCALMRYEDISRARRFFWNHMSRGFLFMENTRKNGTMPGTPEYIWKWPDPTGPEFWALMIRACGFWFLYPLLWIFDIHTVISTCLKIYEHKNEKMDPDCRNHILPSLVMLYKYKTFWSYLNQFLMTFIPWKHYIDYWWAKRKGEPRMDLILYPYVDGCFG